MSKLVKIHRKKLSIENKDKNKVVDVLWDGGFSRCECQGAIIQFIHAYLSNPNNPKHEDIFFLAGQADGNISPQDLPGTLGSPLVVATVAQSPEYATQLPFLYMPQDDQLFVHGLSSLESHWVDWKLRKPIAFWRGECSGGGGRNSTRCRVVEKLLTHPHADVKLSNQHQWASPDIPLEWFSPNGGKRVPFTEFFKYKIFLIVDGNCISSSHMWAFATGCVPIMVSDKIFWFRKYLVPFRDYLPVESDLSDLVERIEWVCTHDQEAEQLAQNAVAFSRKIFSPTFQQTYLRQHIDSLVDLQTERTPKPKHKPFYPIVVCVFGCMSIEKYKLQIKKVMETWGGDTRLHVLYFVGEMGTEEGSETLISFPSVGDDYMSASYKQNMGLKYIHENYVYDYVFVCGTDTYIWVDHLCAFLQSLPTNTKEKACYIGGHGFIKKPHPASERGVYYHSGGAGFLMTMPLVEKIYPQLDTMVASWFQVCSLEMRPACDVCLGYFISKLSNVDILTNEYFYECDFRGHVHGSIFCCGNKVIPQKIITCHSMSLEYFDAFHSFALTYRNPPWCLHLTRHEGTIRNIQNVWKNQVCTQAPLWADYYMNETQANELWKRYQQQIPDTIHTILFTDTCMVARPFLQNLSQHRFFLIIYITNRVDWGCWGEHANDQQFRELYASCSRHERVFFCADNEYDQHYARQRGIHFYDECVNPIPVLLPSLPNPTKSAWFLTSRGTKPETYVHHLRFPYQLYGEGYARYTEHELSEYLGCVHLPYQTNIQSLWENLGMYVVYFIPSLRLIREWITTTTWYYWEEKHTNQLELSVWYYPPNRDLFIYFDSFEDLNLQIQRMTPTRLTEKKQIIRQWMEKNHQDNLKKWERIQSTAQSLRR